ncbi:MAG: SGNH/GDSL hydrolase family protein [Sulfuricaulis sp.]|nr:SGNH/GDSL hydrolase family protein [Sulfuricaulis sp.]
MRRLILLILFFIPLAASAASFSSLYIFGDSLSDPGNIPLVSGYGFPPAPYSDKRFSNGPVAVQYLAPLLGLPVDNSKNYAQGGATTGFVNVLNASSGGFIPSSALTGVRGQVNDYLDRTSSADANALYIVWAGPNDLMRSLENPATFNPAAAIGNALGNLSTAITDLNNAGAQHFLVPNLPDLGKAPRFNGTSSQLGGTLLSGVFDQQLAAMLGQLKTDLQADIMSFNTFGLLNSVVANPAKYGFGNVTRPCLANLACIIDPGIADRYLFWDPIHPTTRGHELLALAMASSLPTAVPLPSALMLLLSGLLVLVRFKKTR